MPSPRDVGAEYDAVADAYDTSFAATPGAARRFRLVDAPQLAAAAGRARVLELGCGTGRLLGAVTARVRAGVDVSARMLAQARRAGLTVLRADAHALPFADASFDAVLAGNATFGHLDLPRAFAECARVLAPGGRLVVHQVARRALLARREAARGIERVADLTRPARAAGLTPEAVHLWRGVRVPPYAIRVPALLERSRVWNHVTIVFLR